MHGLSLKAWKIHWCLTWSVKTWTFPLMWRRTSQMRSACPIMLKRGSSLLPSGRNVLKNNEDDENDGKGWFFFFWFHIVKKQSLQSWQIDSIDWGGGVVVFCSLNMFMQKRYAEEIFKINNTKSHSDTDLLCSSHLQLTSMNMWTLRRFFLCIFIILCFSKHHHIYSFCIVEKYFCLHLQCKRLSQREKISTVLRYKLLRTYNQTELHRNHEHFVLSLCFPYVFSVTVVLLLCHL